MATHIIHSGQPGWEEDAWDAFVASHPDAHPLQLHGWGQLKSEFGWEDSRLGLVQHGRLAAGAQILLRKAPRLEFLPLRVAYVPKGPLVDWQDTDQAATLLAAIWRFCLRRGAPLLKIEPEQPDSPALSRQLRGLGFRPSPRAVQPRTTVWVDLKGSEEEILARMHQKWRYNVRLAARKGVAVRVGAAADLPTFGRLIQATSARNAFGVHSPDYYRRFWELFTPSGHASLLLAAHEGETLAALLTAQLAGKAYYLYGASGNDDRNLMPNHLLQWEAMRWARAHGSVGYDLWGVPDEVGLDAEAPIPDPATGLWGVWRFKRGFGGQVLRYTGAWDKMAVPFLPLYRA